MAAILILAGCGGSTFNVQNPGQPPPQNMAVATTLAAELNPSPFNGGSTVGIYLNGNATATATVTNDSSNAGVDWVMSACQGNGSNCDLKPCLATGNPCGALVNSSGHIVSHSGSAETLTYQPPSVFPLVTPGNNLFIEITTYATADHSVNQTSLLTVTAFDSILSATYILQVQGTDLDGNPYQIAAALQLDAATFHRSDRGFFRRNGLGRLA